MGRWGNGWQVGVNKAIHQHEASLKAARWVLVDEHNKGDHEPGSRRDLCPLCQKMPEQKTP